MHAMNMKIQKCHYYVQTPVKEHEFIAATRRDTVSGKDYHLAAEP
jgi:hypothetical protein